MPVLIAMDCGMASQKIPSCKCLTADCTSKRTLRGMRQEMASQVVFTGKGATTVGALVLFFRRIAASLQR